MNNRVTPSMISNIGYKSYIVFAILNFAAVPIVYFTYPDTSRMPLEAVDLLFADRDGKRPSILRVARDSTNPAFRAEINQILEDRSRIRAEDAELDKPQAERVEDVEPGLKV
jgi:hypothetical protein